MLTKKSDLPLPFGSGPIEALAWPACPAWPASLPLPFGSGPIEAVKSEVARLRGVHEPFRCLSAAAPVKHGL